MKVVNLFGGPGSGKSTLALALTAELKFNGIVAEYVPETARDLIYQGFKDMTNQFFISAEQYRRIKQLEVAGCEIAVVDSPLRQQLIYADLKTNQYFWELKSLVRRAAEEFDNMNVFVRRVKPFSTFGRLQGTEEEAKEFDTLAFWVDNMDMEVDGDRKGFNKLQKAILRKYK